MTTTMTSRAQQKILDQAPRFLFYHAAGSRRGLIPDTAKARAWAVEERGANRLNCLTFHYFGPDRMASDHRVGDFYCVVSDRHTAYLERGLNTRPDKVDTADVALRAQELFSYIFNVANLNCRCTYIAPFTIGVSIPSSAFGMEEGAIFLEDLYYEAVATLSVFGASLGLEVSYCQTVDVENTRLPSGTFAIPFLLDEIPRLSTPLEHLAAAPRAAPNVDCEWQIDPTVLADMKREAVDRWRRRRKKAWTMQRPEPDHLVNPERAHFCNSMHATAAQKCARKLVEWMARKDLTEFGQRDAERAVRQRLHGPSGDGGGVADALRILIGAHYIWKCPLPSMEYLCKRPSPWFLVNPLLYDGIEPRPSAP